MFVLNKERVVKWPVDVALSDNGGVTKPHRYTAHFKLPPDSEVQELTGRDIGNKHLLRAVLVGWDDVAIHGPEPTPFSAEALELLLKDSATFRQATLNAFFDCLLGVPAKNVVTPPATGPAALPTEAAATSSPKT